MTNFQRPEFDPEIRTFSEKAAGCMKLDDPAAKTKSWLVQLTN